MNRYFRLLRLGNGIMGIIGVVIGAFVAIGFDISDHATDIVIASLSVVIFMGGGNALNDYIDREIDKVAHPERPLPKGEIRPKDALTIGIGMLLASVVISMASMSIMITGMVILAAMFMISYELWLKQRGFIGNLTIAVLTGMTFLFGGIVVGYPEANLIIALMAVIVSIGREIAKDIEDVDSDEGRNTLPMLVGKGNASMIASIMFIIGPILSILPIIDGTFGWLYLLVIVADAMFIYIAFLIFHDAHRAQKIAKTAMLVALLAFILGVI